MINIKIIIISGGTSSGKSHLARLLKKSLEKKNKVITFSTDEYYYPLEHYKKANISDPNYDEPNSLNWEQLYYDIKEVLNGRVIKRKKYNYNNPKLFVGETFTIEPCDYLIIEGIFALHSDFLTNIASLNVFVQSDADLRLIRRLRRDKLIQPEFDVFKIIDKWENEIRVMYRNYISPSKAKADLIISNNSNDIENFQVMIKQIKDKLNY